MTGKRKQWHRTLALFGCAMITLVALPLVAQQTSPTPAAAKPAVTAAPAASAKPAAGTKTFKEDELAALLAPIALYPDAVIAQILIASTYPLEVVEANRWVQQHKELKGEALAREAQKQSWDPSVQGLAAVPEVLKMMDEKLQWMQDLGDAVLAQQKDVMAMVQTLRAKAKAEGNLKSDDHMKVSTEPAPATAEATTKTEVIVIQSANPEVIYVPTYSPVSVYGTWGYPAYPPYYWPPPVGYPGSGFWWGVGIGVSIGYWGGGGGGCCWNNSPDWNGGDINIGEINIDRGDRGDARPKDGSRGTAGDRGASAKTTDKSGGQKWSHDPEHRKGVSYKDNATSAKYDRGSTANAGSRDAYRGRTSSSPSAGTRDVGGSDFRSGGASAGTRDVSGGDFRGGGTSAGTRDVGSSGTRDVGSSASRGSSSVSSSNRSSPSRSSSSSFSGMSSGSRASSYSSRGGMSRGGGGGGRRR